MTNNLAKKDDFLSVKHMDGDTFKKPFTLKVVKVHQSFNDDEHKLLYDCIDVFGNPYLIDNYDTFEVVDNDNSHF